MSEPVHVEVETDLLYGRGGAQLLFLDLYRPAVLISELLPVVIYIHGGGWMRGDKLLKRPPFLAETGRYIVASINYRLSDVAIFPAQLHDAKTAVRWLRANAEQYGIDGKRIGVWGHSAGAHLATLLGLTGDHPELQGTVDAAEHSSRVQAVVALAGPTDFSRMGGWHDDADSPESRLVGGPLAQRATLVQQANPLNYVTSAAPPMLLIHGEDDDTVPVEQSQLLHDALQAVGASVQLLRLAECGHNFGPSNPHYERVTAEIQHFFDAQFYRT